MSTPALCTADTYLDGVHFMCAEPAGHPGPHVDECDKTAAWVMPGVRVRRSGLRAAPRETPGIGITPADKFVTTAAQADVILTLHAERNGRGKSFEMNLARPSRADVDRAMRTLSERAAAWLQEVTP